MEGMLEFRDSSDATKFTRITPEGVNISGAIAQRVAILELTLAHILAIPAAGIDLVPAPANNQIVIPELYTISLTVGDVPLADGSNFILTLGPTNNAAINISTLGQNNTPISAILSRQLAVQPMSMFYIGSCLYSTGDFQFPPTGEYSGIGKALVLGLADAPYTGGDDVVKIRIVVRYHIETVVL